VFTNYYNQTKEGDLVTFEVERPKRRKGKYKTKTLQAIAMKVDVVQKNKIKVLDQLTDKQKLTLKSWAGL
jgi:hypothetical protein